MITPILTMMLQLQPQLSVQTAPRMVPAPAIATIAVKTRKQQMMDEGHALLARAEEARSHYRATAGQPSKAELDESIDGLKSDLDSMSEMGEMESLRLQMAMDRLSKLMSTLSNILKKMSDTEQGIVQNLK